MATTSRASSYAEVEYSTTPISRKITSAAFRSSLHAAEVASDPPSAAGSPGHAGERGEREGLGADLELHGLRRRSTRPGGAIPGPGSPETIMLSLTGRPEEASRVRSPSVCVQAQRADSPTERKKPKRLSTVLEPMPSWGPLPASRGVISSSITRPSRNSRSRSGRPSAFATSGGMSANLLIGSSPIWRIPSSTFTPACSAGLPGTILPMRTRGVTPILPAFSWPVEVEVSSTSRSCPSRRTRSLTWRRAESDLVEGFFPGRHSPPSDGADLVAGPQVGEQTPVMPAPRRRSRADRRKSHRRRSRSLWNDREHADREHGVMKGPAL